MIMKTDKIETTQKAKSLYYLFGTAVVFLMLCLVIMPAAAVPGAFSITSIEEGDVLIPGTGVIVRWSASDGADGYKISMRDLTTDTVLFSNYDRGTKRSYSLSASDLTPGHDYRIAVCAYSSSGDAWFERCFSVGDAPAINAVYATPESGNAGSTFSFTVWANEFTYNVGIEIDGYLIGTSDEYLYIKGQNVFVIEHLVTSPGNNRVVTAYAYSYDGSEKLTEGTAQTEITVLESPPAGVPTISSPLENSIHGIGEDLKVTWKAPSTSPDSYTVYLYHGSDILYHTSVSSTSVTIPGEYITSYGSYSIDVYSVKSGYSKDIPGNVFINVESPNLPAGVPVLSSPSATGTYYVNEDLTVSWTAPSTNPDSYCIWLYGGGMSGGVLFDDIDETSFTIPGDKLANAGSYSVYVYAEKEGYVKDDSGNVLFSVQTRPSYTANAVVDAAKGWLGKTPSSILKSDGTRYWSEGNNWCSYFIGAAADKAGASSIFPKMSTMASCGYGFKWFAEHDALATYFTTGPKYSYTKNGIESTTHMYYKGGGTYTAARSYTDYQPKVGDLVYFLFENDAGDIKDYTSSGYGKQYVTFSHVELVSEVNGDYITTVAGNSGKGTTETRKVVEHTLDWTTGGKNWYGYSAIVAYARPNYATVTEESLPTLAKPIITVPSADIDIYPGQELKVSWTTSGTSPTKYIVQVFREGDFVGSFETSDKTITIPSSCLNILGEYSIDIYPVRDGYDSNVWSSVYFSVVSPVGDLTINSPSLDASLPAGYDVTVSWSKASSATGYLLSLRDLTTDEIVGGFNRTDVGNVLSYPIGVLTAGHEYRAAVGAYSPLSDYVHWTTTTFSVSTVSVPSVTPSVSLKYADNYYVRSDAKIEGDAVREQALSTVMSRYQGVVDTSKPVIYFIEGYGSSLKSTSLSTAMCVVVIDGEIVFVSTNSATLPDQPYHPVTNDGTDLPTVVDGTYSVTNTLHRDYPALHVTTPPVVRIHVADECTDKGKCGSTTSAGINIHKPSSTSIVSETKDWANSAGCLLVGMHDSGENIYYGGEKRFQASNKEYDRFASVLGFAKSTYSENGISYGKTKLGDLGKKTVCSVVIDRQYGYKNNAEFKSYLDTKYKNNNEVISKIIGSEYDYSVNVPENKPVEEKPLIFAVSTVLDEADLTDDTPIVVFWDVSDGALGYTFSMRDLTLDKKWIDNVDTNGRCTYTLSVEMLAAGHEYRVAVCAYNDAGETWVEYAFSIPEDESEIIPSSFIISDVSSPISVDQPLEITWTESIGATGYRFTLMDISESNVIENTTVGNELRYIIQAGKLAYGHDYCVAVSAYNDAGETWAEMEFSISPEACVLSFDANGGSGSMSPITGSSGKSYVLPECTFTAPAGKEFKAWIIGSDEYTPSSYYTPTSSVTIKALWVDSISTPEVTGTPDTSWYDADSLQFVISTADELAGLAQLVNKGTSFENKIIDLDADIDLSEYPNWTPIGTENRPFKGKFFGNGHVISNLTVIQPEMTGVGLFGTVYGQSEVCGVGILNFTIVGNNNVGSLVGFAESRSLGAIVSECLAYNGTVAGNYSVGGLIGGGDGTLIISCMVVSVDVSGIGVGGLAASLDGISSYYYGESSSEVMQCMVIGGAITGNNSVGGLVGGSSPGGVVDSLNIYNSIVLADSIVGDNADGAISFCGVSNSGVGKIGVGVWDMLPINNDVRYGDFDQNGGVIYLEDFWNNQTWWEERCELIFGYDGNVGHESAWAMGSSENYKIPYLRDFPMIQDASCAFANGYAENTKPGNFYLSSPSDDEVFSDILSIYSSSLSVYWFESPAADSYIVSLYDKTTSVEAFELNIDAESYDGHIYIKDDSLTPGHEYLLSVTAVNEYGTTVATAPRNIIVLSVAEALAKVLDADVSGNTVTLTKNVSITRPICISLEEDEEIILTTSGNYTILRECKGDLFTIESGTLTLKGKDANNLLIIDGNKDAYTSEYSNSLMYLHGGNLELSEYAVLINNYAEDGCVNVQKNSTLYITGGSITKNEGVNAGAIQNYDTIIMSDGLISENTAEWSGGISNSGVFKMSGGEISCNSVTNQYGTGGVNVAGGEFIMTGGTISQNTGYNSVEITELHRHTEIDGIWYESVVIGKFSISGDAVIPASDKVFLHKNTTGIIVTGPLSKGAGVYNIDIGRTTGVVVDATEAKISGKDLLSHFVLNKDGYKLEANGNCLVFPGSNPTPTPDKPESPILTPSESLPTDAEITTNTVAETNAATKAEVGYQISPTEINEMKAPTITRGSLSVMLNDNVKVVKILSDGSEVEVEATVNEDGSISINDSLDGAESVTVNFIGRQFGDVTNDGKPDTLDAARVLQASVGLYDFSNADTFYGDVSGDGFANTLDAARILQYSVNLVDDNYVTKA